MDASRAAGMLGDRGRIRWFTEQLPQTNAELAVARNKRIKTKIPLTVSGGREKTVVSKPCSRRVS